MGKVTGFMEYEKSANKYRAPVERVKDFDEFIVPQKEEMRIEQAARCMDCGIPFCHSSYGCPVENLIPEWNDLIYQGEWKKAYARLRKTNNFPEYTGRVCPAPCETACVLGINNDPVTIKDNEYTIVERAYAEGWVKPTPPKERNGKKVAVVGSGPAGLAAADQLNMKGFHVTVFERDDRIGGLLMYGIPNMKLDKKIIERRNKIMEEEGVVFQTNTCIGKDIEMEQLISDFDAVLLTCGSTVPRDLSVPGRDLQGIHFAMEFLKKNTQSLLNSNFDDGKYINAKDKDVIVIGGGDTGNDCIGTSMRHGAKSVVNFELLSKPHPQRSSEHPWPLYPRVLKNDYGHSEVQAVHGKDPREFSILTKEFLSEDGKTLSGIKTIEVKWEKQEGGGFPKMHEVPGTEKIWQADLVFLALGFLGPEQQMLDSLKLEKDARSNIKAEYGVYKTSHNKVFAAGDARRGQSLVVWAIHEGREAANAIEMELLQ